MFPHMRVVLLIVMACFAVVLSHSGNAFAGGVQQKPLDKPDPNLGVPQTIINKLDQIQQTLEDQVIPKLEECPQCPGIGVPKTGQIIPYGAGDDGVLQKGIPLPIPRFTDSGNGTVTDKLTGLIWLKNANCFVALTWSDALNACNNLASGACGLTDSSSAGEWRLPNIRELTSLIHYGFIPVVPNTFGTAPWKDDGDPFTNVVGYWYWSSTTYADNPVPYAWIVTMGHGVVQPADKNNALPVWPVRGGN